MALSFPLSVSGLRAPRRFTMRADSVVGVSKSPFTRQQQVQVHQGTQWGADVDVPPMSRAEAAAWIAKLVALNGREGTLLMGPVETSPQGLWAGSPNFNDPHAAGVKTIWIKGMTVGTTGKAGDYFQVGSGASAHLHMLVQDFVADASGHAPAAEIWPPLREAVVDGVLITTSSPVGLWRLASNVREWSIDLAHFYGLGFSVEEAL